MKFSELKNKFKNKYAIRVIAGVLMVAMLGTSYGVWQVNAAKPSTESVSEETTEKEASTEDTDAENADAEETKSELKDQLGNLLFPYRNSQKIVWLPLTNFLGIKPSSRKGLSPTFL